MGLSSKLASSDVALDWSQELLENGGLQITKPMNQARNNNNNNQQQQRQHWPPLKCPRCESTNTKFCYYNNYSRTQPRHFCKACRRHWTEGGTLRNVPVGGGRKNKRSKATPSAATASTVSSRSTAAKLNSISNSTPLPLAQQVQQQKFPLLFGGDHSSSIFPEILRQVLHRPPPPPSDHSFTTSLLSDPILPPPQLKPAFMDSSNGNNNNNAPFSISSSSYSYPLASASSEGLNTINSSSAWQVGPVTAFPTSTSGLDHSSADYWSCWDDDLAGCS